MTERNVLGGDLLACSYDPLTGYFRDGSCAVHDQDGVGVAETGGDVVAQVITHPVGVPHRAAQQVLHTVRIAVAGVFGDRPTVLARQVGEQPEQEPAGAAAGLDPSEPTGHPFEQPVGLGLPSPRPYAVAHGHRLII